MSNPNDPVEVLKGTYLFVIVATMVIAGAMLIFAGIVFSLPIALAAVGTVAYLKSPYRRERLLQQEVARLEANTRLLDVDEIDAELIKYLPPDLPIQDELRDIGRAVAQTDAVTRPPKLDSVEGARYRDSLIEGRNRQRDNANAIAHALATFAEALPSTTGTLSIAVRDAIDTPHVIEGMASALIEAPGLRDVKRRLERNLAAAKVLPSAYRGDDLVGTYLRGTGLERLFDLSVPYGIPEAARLEHWYLAGGSGHGKTQTIQWLIAQDIDRINRGDCSVVVIDSQGQLFRQLLAYKNVDPDRYVVVDAEDIDHPIGLNLFDINRHRIDGYSRVDQERLLGNAIETLSFVIGSLLDARMTAKQEVAFKYVTHLMLHVPNATILDMVKLFRDDGLDEYEPYLDRLSPLGQSFFREEFAGRGGRAFNETRHEVLRRLYDVLESPTFRRMFSIPENKIDLVREMDEGKLILIHPSIHHLGAKGASIMGRFFIAMLLRAAYERGEHAKPCYVIVDEAQDFFDASVERVLDQARKYKVGFFAAHQRLSHLTPDLLSAFKANTSIKMLGGVSHDHARSFATDMRTTPDFILSMRKQDRAWAEFATYVRGNDRSVRVQIPFGVMEGLPQRSRGEIADVIAQSRNKYATDLDEALNTASMPAAEPVASEAPGSDCTLQKPQANGSGEAPPDSSNATPHDARPQQNQKGKSKRNRSDQADNVSPEW